MKTPTIVKDEIGIDVTAEISRFTMRLGAAVCALVGIWGLACLASALVGSGVVGMIKGYVIAVSGL